ncbi:MAG: aryl-sulfate sulfotransferase [Bacteroidales bacterium]|nr:aryl-sulfate sulfotransferase [Bacteroidales bacterium]
MKMGFNLVILFCIPLILFGQENNTRLFEYLLPVPGNKQVTPQQNIVIRQGSIIHLKTLKQLNARVKGADGVEYNGDWVVSDDNKSLIFNHQQDFEKEQEITVEVDGIMLANGNKLPTLKYWFKTRKHSPKMLTENHDKFNSDFMLIQTTPSFKKSKWPELPEDYPATEVTISNNPSPGYFYALAMDIWWNEEQVPYLMIMDNTGYPVFYEKLEKHGMDFKVQPNGQISHYYSIPHKHRILNKKFKVIDSYQVKNGYSHDFHEFVLLENGHALMLGHDDRLVDMDTVVNGGHEGVTVRGTLVQELDSDKNVIFQWSSFDHYEITDATEFVDLKSESLIDYVHANAIDPTDDNALLISARNLNEITKIDRSTGEIIWRFSGENNDFIFENDTLGFSMQHDIRYRGNDHYSLFDNGWFNTDQTFSSGVEYHLDEENMTATLTKRLRSQPEDIFGIIMGNFQYIQNGRTVVGWGSGIPNITEFKVDGTVALELKFHGINYRAYKFDYEQAVFETSSNTLDFGYIVINQSNEKQVILENLTDEAIQINHCHFRSELFSLITELPVTIQAGDSATFDIEFRPGSQQGRADDVATFCYDVISEELTRRIAVQVALTGYTSASEGIKDNPLISSISPNPGNGLIKLETRKNFNGHIHVVNMNGNIMYEAHKYMGNITEIDLRHLVPGIYLLSISNEDCEREIPMTTKIFIR